MKTNYHHRNSFGRPRPAYGIYVTCIIAFIIVWIFHSFFSSLVYTAARPLLSVKNSVFSEFSFVSDFINSHASLAKENEALREQASIDAINLSESQTILAENEALKGAIGYTGSTTDGALAAARSIRDKGGVLAYVLEAPGVSPYDTLVVDAGSNEGVQVGDIARVGNVTTIGLVTQVFSDSSIVTLLSSSNQQLNVMVASSTPATAYGRGSGNFIVTLPKSASGSLGDSVTVPLYGNDTIGKVMSVESDDADSLKNLYIGFPFSVQTLSVVTLYPH